MNKKYLSITVVLLVMSILVTGCGTGRDLSRPSTRMVGHWGSDDPGIYDQRAEVYFGEVDEEGFGPAFIWMNAAFDFVWDEDVSEYFKYRVDSESGDAVKISAFFEGEPFPESWEIGEVAKDGQSLLFWGAKMQYIDSKTEP